MINIKKPLAVLFDFDDTLVDTGVIVDLALKNTFASYNIDFKQIKSKYDLNRSARDYFKDIFKDKVHDATALFYDNYHKISHDNLIPFAGAEKLLETLKQKQIYTAVVSNKKSHILNREINEILGWNIYFKNIVGSGDAREDKPSILPALLALNDLELKNYDDVWFIGDSIVDLETANNLGCKAILFESKNININRDNYNIFQKFNNHHDLLNFFLKVL